MKWMTRDISRSLLYRSGDRGAVMASGDRSGNPEVARTGRTSTTQTRCQSSRQAAAAYNTKVETCRDFFLSGLIGDRYRDCLRECEPRADITVCGVGSRISTRSPLALTCTQCAGGRAARPHRHDAGTGTSWDVRLLIAFESVGVPVLYW